MDVTRMRDGLIADSNAPRRKRQTAREAYESQAAVQATVEAVNGRST
jgi:hypothetical protein